MAEAHDPKAFQSCLDRFVAGEESALNELLSCAIARLRHLTRRMFQDFSRVRRWEETDDVLQNASMRLVRALQTEHPTSVAGFMALAALQIRRELIDLARRYYGPEGLGTHHDSGIGSNRSSAVACLDPEASQTADPRRMTLWTDFHHQAGQLCDDDRAVFDLIYYQGLPQAEAATLLGISERTLQRRWQSARLTLYDALGGQLPE